MASIYGIFFNCIQKVYVGATQDDAPVARWWRHLKKLRAGNHECNLLQAAFNRHGESAIRWVVLEPLGPIEPLQMFAAEQRWIDHYARIGGLLNSAKKVTPSAARRADRGAREVEPVDPAATEKPRPSALPR